MVDKETEKKIIQKAFEMKEKAYCPYSKYQVGAALLTKDGKIFGGHNIENSSYGATICAERCSVFNAVSSGERDFAAIAICGGLVDQKQKGSGGADPALKQEHLPIRQRGAIGRAPQREETSRADHCLRRYG